MLDYIGGMMNPYEKKIINTIRKEAGRIERISDIRKMRNDIRDNLRNRWNRTDADDLVVNADPKGKLKQGDKVLMARVSEDTYAIFMKVVEHIMFPFDIEDEGSDAGNRRRKRTGRVRS